MICSLSKQLFLKLFLEDDLFCCSMLGNGTSISKDSSWTGNEASITKWRFKYDTKLAMRSNAFSLLLALEQISEICSWKWSSELVKTPSSVSFVLDLIEEPPKCDSVVFLNFTRDAIFQDCFSHGYFWTKWKAHEMWNVIFYIPNIPSMKESVTFTVVFAISKSESFIENKKIKTFWGWKTSQEKEHWTSSRCYWFL